MTASFQYQANDFTEANYQKLLLLAKNKFTFSDYCSAKEKDRIILWRHDIDFSPHRAYALAKIEAELNIKATYFLYLHSFFYNLFEAEITELIKKIISLGHKIGLHFDCSYYGISNQQELEFFLTREKQVIEELFNCKLEVFSFHNPGGATKVFTAWKYAEIVNTYADYFKINFNYCSDSNGYWRFCSLEDVLQDNTISKLQVLTHPGWWTKETMTPREKITRCIEGRFKKSHELYDHTLEKFGRENIR